MRYARIIMVLITASLSLSACGGIGSPVQYKSLYFSQYQPIYMNVSSIEVVEEYKSPMRPPFVEHLLPYSPSEAVRIWARDRLRTAGDERTMQIIVRTGSVTAKSSGGGGISRQIPLVSSGGQTTYDARLEVEMRLYGASAISEASVFVNATRTATLPSHADDHTRQILFRKLISDMMDEFNAEMEKNLFLYMGNYINYSYSP